MSKELIEKLEAYKRELKDGDINRAPLCHTACLTKTIGLILDLEIERHKDRPTVSVEFDIVISLDGVRISNEQAASLLRNRRCTVDDLKIALLHG